MAKILKLLETLSRKSLVGTLVLGQKKRSFDVFVEDKLLYLMGSEFLGKVDLDGLFESKVFGERFSENDLESLVISTDLGKSLVPEVLFTRNVIDRDGFQKLIGRQLQEELFAHLMSDPASFYFQEGFVPDSIIGKSSITLKNPIHLRDFLGLLRTRLDFLKRIREAIPDPNEVFVITEKGMARKQQASDDFGLQRVVDLIDGFRNLSSIIKDGYLYPFYVEGRIFECLEEGWIKKTQLPEIREVDPTTLTTDEAERYVPLYKAAIKFGTDELFAREGYAKLMARLDKKEEAVIQYNFMGDTLFQMGRRAQAIRAYFEGLKLVPENPLISEKVVRIYHAEAKSKIEQGKPAEAVGLYNNSLEIQPDNATTLHALIDLHARVPNRVNIAEICDQTASRARVIEDPTTAIEILRKVISNEPANPAYYKKLINLCLDFNRTKEALDEMERLALIYIESGKVEKGSVLVDKILRIDSGRKHLWDYSRTPPLQVRRASRVYWTRLGVHVGLTVLLVTMAYQLWTFYKFQPIRRHEYLAHADASWPNSRDLIESRLERKLRSLARSTMKFEEENPLSVFRVEAARLKKRFDASRQLLRKAREQRKEEIVAEIHEHLDRGNFNHAKIAFRQLLECPSDDAWRVKAQTDIDGKRQEQVRAATLYQQAKDARDEEKWEEAYRISAELIDNYPQSPMARKIRFPVIVESVPSGARVRFHGGQGFTPLRVDIPPSALQPVTLELDGFETVTVNVSPDDGPWKTVSLRQKPLWIVSEPRFKQYAPLLRNGSAHLVSRSGDLYAVDLADGSVQERYETPTLIDPISSPLDCGSFLILPLNDGHILRLRPGSKGAGSFHVKEGLISTPLLAIENTYNVAFGTSRDWLVEYDPLSDAVVRRLKLRRSVSLLANCGTGSVLAIDTENVLLRADLLKQRIVWKVKLFNKALSAPVFLGDRRGGTVLVLMAKNQLTALEPNTGAVLWINDLEGKAERLDYLRRTKRLLIHHENGSVTEVDPDSARLTPIEKPIFATGYATIQELSRDLAVFKDDGAFHLIDDNTLQIKWSFRPREESRVVAATLLGRTIALVDDAGALWVFQLPPGI